MNVDDFYGGTTILAAEFDEGVVIAADSRTSCRTYVSNRSADKLTRITDHIYCCRSGSASHTQSLSHSVSQTLTTNELCMGETALVSDAALEFRNKIYAARRVIVASVIVAGWDRLKGGQVYSVPMSGLVIREPCAVSGSGAAYIHGFISANFRCGMSRDSTIDMAKRAVKLAMQHDCSSGGVVRIGVITAFGMESFVSYTEDNSLVKFTNTALWNLQFGAW